MKGFITTAGLICLLLALPASAAYAQRGGPPTPGARGLALGGAGLAFQDIHAAWSNPAGLGYLERWAGAVYGEQLFNLPELRQFSAAVVTTQPFGALGLTLGYYGFEVYNEQRVGFVYGRQLFPKLSLGAQLFVLSTRIPDYGSTLDMTFEIGLQSQVTEEFILGVRAYSPLRVEVIDGEYLPSVLALGASYAVSPQVLLLAEVEKDINFPARVRAGLEYQLAGALLLRAGVATNPLLLSFGAGYRIFDAVAIDLGASYHERLGTTPGITVRFGK